MSSDSSLPDNTPMPNDGQIISIPLARGDLEEQAMDIFQFFKTTPKWIYIGLTLLIGALLLFLLTVFFVPQLIKSATYLSLISGLPLPGAFSVLAPAVLMLIRTRFGMTLTEEGLTIMGFRVGVVSNGPSLFVPWNAIEAVRLEHVNTSEFQVAVSLPGTQYIVFDIDPAKVPKSSRLSLYLHASNCLNLLNPKTWTGDYLGKCKLKILRQEIPSDEDFSTLLHSMEKHLPQGSIDASLHLLVDGRRIEASAPTVTQLWLEQLHEDRSDLGKGSTVTGRSIQAKSKVSYTVVAELSSGGQAVTYRARRTTAGSLDDANTDEALKDLTAGSKEFGGNLGDEIVLKEFVLPLAGADGAAKALANIEREYSLLRSLDHPKIVKCLDMFVSGRRAYLVLSYLPGTDLKQLVRHSGPLKEETVVDIAVQICETLDYLHKQIPQVVHRDITPDNILLDESGSATLLDFTVATHSVGATTNSVVGKTNYMSPDQFRGEISPACDIYSLGATMHFLLTGKDPEPISVCFPNKLAPVSDSLNAIVSRATAQSAADRYESAEVMRKDLLALREAVSS